MSPVLVLNVIGDLCIANHLNTVQVNKVAESMELLFTKEEVEKEFSMVNDVLDWVEEQ